MENQPDPLQKQQQQLFQRIGEEVRKAAAEVRQVQLNEVKNAFIQGYVACAFAAGVLDPKKHSPDGEEFKQVVGKAKGAFQRWQGR